jgi:AcrR family transcriptional regulator
MPKIVDWDARRDEILSATWRVIARDGIARATIRAIAREADCSRGILAHYFDDKADILGSALLLSHRRVVARMEARAAGLTGLAVPRDERRDGLRRQLSRRLRRRWLELELEALGVLREAAGGPPRRPAGRRAAVRELVADQLVWIELVDRVTRVAVARSAGELARRRRRRRRGRRRRLRRL